MLATSIPTQGVYFSDMQSNVQPSPLHHSGEEQKWGGIEHGFLSGGLKDRGDASVRYDESHAVSYANEVEDAPHDDDDSEQSAAEHCHCISVLEDLCRASEYTLCVEYGSTFLESIRPGEVTVQQALRVLELLTIAFTRIAEVERGKTTLQLWLELLDSSRFQIRGLERHHWRQRYWDAAAELHKANGEREEAVNAYVMSWRTQALLYGPESLKCTTTYLRIAELKVQLLLDDEAMDMLNHTKRLLGSPTPHVLRMWTSMLRLRSIVSERQREMNAARRDAAEAVQLLQEACRASHGRRPHETELDVSSVAAVDESAIHKARHPGDESMGSYFVPMSKRNHIKQDQDYDDDKSRAAAAPLGGYAVQHHNQARLNIRRRAAREARQMALELALSLIRLGDIAFSIKKLGEPLKVDVDEEETATVQDDMRMMSVVDRGGASDLRYALERYHEGIVLLEESLPVMHPLLVRAKLRLALMVASAGQHGYAFACQYYANNINSADATEGERGGGEAHYHQRQRAAAAAAALSSSSPSTYFHKTLVSEMQRHRAAAAPSKKNNEATATSSASAAGNNTTSFSLHLVSPLAHEQTNRTTLMPSTTTSTHVARDMILRWLDELSQSEVRGGRHVALMIEMHETLGDLGRRLGDHRQAATSYHRAKAAASQLFAPDHERCALLQHKLAEALLSAGHCEDAISLLLELREWCLLCPAGRMPPVPLYVLNHSLGSAMRFAERFKSAEEYFHAALHDEAIDFQTKAKVLGNLGAMYLTMSDVKAALRCNFQALLLRTRQLGEEHEDVAASHANIASLYHRADNPKEALFHADKCICILERRGGQHKKKKHHYPPKSHSSSAMVSSVSDGGEDTTTGPTAPHHHHHAAFFFADDSRVCLPPKKVRCSSHPFYVDVSRVKAWAIRTLKQQSASSSSSKQQPFLK